jgi:hypothetical protein
MGFLLDGSPDYRLGDLLLFCLINDDCVPEPEKYISERDLLEKFPELENWV